MAIKGYCERQSCADCTTSCTLDESIPCSPDCENLTDDGKILIEKCLQDKCEEVKHLFNMENCSDKELLREYGSVNDYPYAP